MNTPGPHLPTSHLAHRANHRGENGSHLFPWGPALFILLALAGVAMTGCKMFQADTPPPVYGACEGLGQLNEMQAENAISIIGAYEADLIAAWDAHSKERLDNLIAKGGYDTPDKIKGLVVAFSENRDRYRTESDARKARFTATCAANAKSGKVLVDALRKYLDSLGDERKNLEAVINAIKPTLTPTTRPTTGD